MLRVGLVAVPNHAKQAVRLRYAVDGEGRIEDFVTAMLAVGLREHHQLNVGRVALQLGESLHQVVDLVGGQRQAKAGVGGLQRRPALPQHIDLRHRRGRHRSKQTVGGCALLHHALGHAVMQQVSQRSQLCRAEAGFAQPALAQLEPVVRDPLHPLHRQPAVVRDVSGLGGPGRHRAKARRHHQQDPARSALVGFAVSQQGRELVP